MPPACPVPSEKIRMFLGMPATSTGFPDATLQSSDPACQFENWVGREAASGEMRQDGGSEELRPLRTGRVSEVDGEPVGALRDDTA